VPQPQIELQATMASWAMYGAALRWSNADRKESAQQFARNALPFIMQSMELPSTKPAAAKLHRV
jgi:hypothetical protein